MLSALQSLSLCPLSASGQREVATLTTRTLITHIKQEGGCGLWGIMTSQMNLALLIAVTLQNSGGTAKKYECVT